MNCSDYQYRIHINPYDEDPELQRHAEQCPACAEETRRLRLLDQRLRRALEVTPPPRLKAGIQQKIQSEEKRSKRFFWRTFSVLASLGLLAIGLIWLWPEDPSQKDAQLVSAVEQHVVNEWHSLQVDQGIQPEQVELLVHNLGGQLLADFSQVRYAGRCRMLDEDGLHLVLAGQKGPVTVLWMPGDHISKKKTVKSTQLTKMHLQGLVMPLNAGSLAVVAQPNEDFDYFAHRAIQALGLPE